MVVAKDGQEGLDKARSCQPDIILLDMNLPIVDGWTIARTLKAETTTSAIPVIALTAHAMSGDKQSASFDKPTEVQREQLWLAFISRAAGTWSFPLAA